MTLYHNTSTITIFFYHFTIFFSWIILTYHSVVLLSRYLAAVLCNQDNFSLNMTEMHGIAIVTNYHNPEQSTITNNHKVLL